MKKSLSARQQRMLQFIRNYFREKGYPPSIRDIAQQCEISSTSVVDYNLRLLERQGYILRDREVSRGIRLAEGEGAWPRRVIVPLIGRIAAGEPIPVPAGDSWRGGEELDTLELSEEMLRGKQGVYALQVRGTSMIDALINDGDVVLMQYANTAENGDMVAVWLKQEKEVTLKKFYLERGRVRLQPANVEMKPIYTDPANVEIQGKVVAVIRQL